MLSSLSEEEIVMLGTIAKYYVEHVSDINNNNNNNNNVINQCVGNAIDELASKENNQISVPYEHKARCRAIAIGLLRTGMFELMATPGSPMPMPTILFEDFISYFDNVDKLIITDEE